MAKSKTVQIKVGKKQTLYAVHSKPLETGLIDREHKLVIFLHGFPGHRDSHDEIAANLESILIDQGFHSLRFDFIGCGDSSGDQPEFSLAKAKECLHAVKKWSQLNGYSEFVYISDGIGSTIAILNTDIDVTCQVMLWPGLDPQYLAKTLFKSDAIEDEWRKVGYVVQGDNRIGIPFVNELLKTKLAASLRDITMPVLIMHGSADSLYPLKHLDIARQRMTSKRIEITTFHNAENGLPELEHRKSMFYHITQFLEKYA